MEPEGERSDDGEAFEAGTVKIPRENAGGAAAGAVAKVGPLVVADEAAGAGADRRPRRIAEAAAAALVRREHEAAPFEVGVEDVAVRIPAPGGAVGDADLVVAEADRGAAAIHGRREQRILGDNGRFVVFAVIVTDAELGDLRIVVRQPADGRFGGAGGAGEVLGVHRPDGAEAIEGEAEGAELAGGVVAEEEQGAGRRVDLHPEAGGGAAEALDGEHPGVAAPIDVEIEVLAAIDGARQREGRRRPVAPEACERFPREIEGLDALGVLLEDEIAVGVGEGGRSDDGAEEALAAPKAGAEADRGRSRRAEVDDFDAGVGHEDARLGPRVDAPREERAPVEGVDEPIPGLLRIEGREAIGRRIEGVDPEGAGRRLPGDDAVDAAERVDQLRADRAPRRRRRIDLHLLADPIELRAVADLEAVGEDAAPLIDGHRSEATDPLLCRRGGEGGGVVGRRGRALVGPLPGVAAVGGGEARKELEDRGRRDLGGVALREDVDLLDLPAFLAIFEGRVADAGRLSAVVSEGDGDVHRAADGDTGDGDGDRFVRIGDGVARGDRRPPTRRYGDADLGRAGGNSDQARKDVEERLEGVDAELLEEGEDPFSGAAPELDDGEDRRLDEVDDEVDPRLLQQLFQELLVELLRGVAAEADRQEDARHHEVDEQVEEDGDEARDLGAALGIPRIGPHGALGRRPQAEGVGEDVDLRGAGGGVDSELPLGGAKNARNPWIIGRRDVAEDPGPEEDPVGGRVDGGDAGPQGAIVDDGDLVAVGAALGLDVEGAARLAAPVFMADEGARFVVAAVLEAGDVDVGGARLPSPLKVADPFKTGGGVEAPLRLAGDRRDEALDRLRERPGVHVAGRPLLVDDGGAVEVVEGDLLPCVVEGVFAIAPPAVPVGVLLGRRRVEQLFDGIDEVAEARGAEDVVDDRHGDRRVMGHQRRIVEEGPDRGILCGYKDLRVIVLGERRLHAGDVGRRRDMNASGEDDRAPGAGGDLQLVALDPFRGKENVARVEDRKGVGDRAVGEPFAALEGREGGGVVGRDLVAGRPDAQIDVTGDPLRRERFAPKGEVDVLADLGGRPERAVPSTAGEAQEAAGRKRRRNRRRSPLKGLAARDLNAALTSLRLAHGTSLADRRRRAMNVLELGTFVRTAKGRKRTTNRASCQGEARAPRGHRRAHSPGDSSTLARNETPSRNTNVKTFLARTVYAVALAFVSVASVVACDDEDPTPSSVDAGSDDGAAKTCKTSSACSQGVCSCRTPGKEGVACCSVTSTQPCTAGDCVDVCYACQ
ncbi:hypothetical protein OUZ56_032386 [Daphnia magna]|uniref:Uncharacterized protein n=1 Tax=Daphnia magna TaxID=35525 RepID=A0ABR0B8S1_9CRUS|nr:hypothetical protein OUZ56_032386 [Daphnia magna]